MKVALTLMTTLAMLSALAKEPQPLSPKQGLIPVTSNGLAGPDTAYTGTIQRLHSSEQQRPGNNTALYFGIGAGVLVVGGLGFTLGRNRKS